MLFRFVFESPRLIAITTLLASWFCYSATAVPVKLDLATTSSIARIYGPSAASLIGSGECRGIAYGDINGDGYADLILGAPQDGIDGRPSCGSVLVFYGSIAATSTTADLASTSSQAAAVTRILGPTTLAKLGYAVASGDFDGDGYDDISIGAPFAVSAPTTGTAISSGEAFIIWGRSDAQGLVVDLATTDDSVTTANETRISNTQDNCQLGWSVAASDLNGDGYADLSIGTPNLTATPAKTAAGATYLVRGSAGLRGQKLVLGTGTPSGTHETIVYGSSAGESCGYSLAAGDLNGDGYPDLSIGAANAALSGGRSSAGRAWTLYGGPGNAGVTSGTGYVLDLASGSTTVTKYLGDAANDRLSAAIACGDVNGDGISDLVLGSPSYAGGNATNAYIVYGSASLPASQLDFATTAGIYGETRVVRGATYEGAGEAVSAGDIDGDGTDDLLIGAPEGSPGDPARQSAGKLYIFFGSSAASKLGEPSGSGSALYLDSETTDSLSPDLPAVDTSIPYDFYTDTLPLYTGLSPVVNGVSTLAIDSANVAVLRGRVVHTSGDPYPGVSVSSTSWTKTQVRIEAEDFTGGSSPVEGVDYHDNSSGNIGDNTTYRSSNVDLGHGGTGVMVGWTAKNEWMRYKWYGGGHSPAGWQITVNYASDNGSQSCQFEIDGLSTYTVTMPDTAGWLNFKSASVWVASSAFENLTTHTIRLISTSGPTSAPAGGANYDYFEIEASSYPSTTTASDGSYNLVVNGPAKADITYSHAGCVKAYRTINPVQVRSFNDVPDVALVDYDTSATAITFGSGTSGFQTALQAPVTDTSGTRQAVMLIPPATTATLILPNGSQSVTTLTLRMTELTVGELGDEQMPAPLPEGTAYMYCVDVAADEALAAGASSVQFGKPVPYYIDNFLNFPVGSVIPAGYYNETTKGWLPYPDGLVISILSISGGSAALDLDGNGTADDSSTTMSIAQGISDAERQQLATLYAGKTLPFTLWRVPLNHLCKIDFNCGYSLPSWAKAPFASLINAFSPENDCNKHVGGFVGIKSQTFMESMPISGTPYQLRYSSARVLGNKSRNRVGANYPPGPDKPGQAVEFLGSAIEITYLGKKVPVLEEVDEPDGKTKTAYWEPDGLDTYGRYLPGLNPFKIRVGYQYKPIYLLNTPSASQPAGSFGTGMVFIPGATSMSDNFATPARRVVTLWKDLSSVAYAQGRMDARKIGLGGWDLDCHHFYNPMTKTMYYGDGSERHADDLGPYLELQIGGQGSAESNVPLAGQLFTVAQGSLPEVEPQAFTMTPDGASWFAYHTDGQNKVARIDPNGTVQFPNIPGAKYGMATGPDGYVYYSYYDGVSKWYVKRFNPKTFAISTVAGGGSNSAWKPLPALDAAILPIHSIAFASDGSLYLAEGFGQAADAGKIRRLAPDGTLYPFAGDGGTGYNGTDIPATTAHLNGIDGLAVGPDRSVYVADNQHRVKRITPDGIIHTIAGNGTTNGPTVDTTTALNAALLTPANLTVTPDGRVYIADLGTKTVRVILPNGNLTTVAGGGQDSTGRAVQARALGFSGIFAMTSNPDGSVFLGAINSGSAVSIRKFGTPFPGYGYGNYTIASEDGSEVYTFSNQGRHLATLHALTGAPLLTFGYTADGELATVTDAYNNVTTINHDANGDPTEILAPFGQKTRLGCMGSGYLDGITNPANETTSFIYKDQGLLCREFLPLGQKEEIEYGSDGSVQSTTNADGGVWKLEPGPRTPSSVQVTIYNQNSPNHKEIHTSERFDDRSWRITNENCCGGGKTVIERQAAGKVIRTSADGTITTAVLAPDPRFGMQAPYAKTVTVKTPGGRTATGYSTSTVSLMTGGDLFSISTASRNYELAGAIEQNNYSGSARRLVTTSPEGRVSTRTINTEGEAVSAQDVGAYSVDTTIDQNGFGTQVIADSGVTQQKAQFGYDSLRNLVLTTNTLGQLSSFTPDLAGRITQANLPATRTIGFDYNQNGWLTSLTPPGQPAHRFNYSGTGRALSYTPPGIPGAGSTTIDYDGQQRPQTVHRPDGSSIAFSFNATSSWLDSITASDFSLGYTYNTTTGNITQVVRRNGTGATDSTATFTYDGSMPLTSAYSGNTTGTLSNSYDSKLRLSARSVSSTASISYSYDKDNLLTKVGDLLLTRTQATGFTSETQLQSLIDSRVYDSSGRLQRYSATTAGPTTIDDVQYGYDVAGRISVTTYTLAGDPSNTHAYTYDTAGRLCTVLLNGSVISSFAYDANGNRTEAWSSTSGTTTTASFDAQDRMTATGNRVYAYTANGELSVTTDTMSGTVTKFAWNGAGALKQVVLPDTTQIDYVYDALGHRVGKNVNGSSVQRFVWEGALRPAAEISTTGVVTARYVYATHVTVPDYILRAGNEYRLITDHLGSVRLVVNANTGAIVQRLDYDEWGNVSNDTNPGFQPFGYAGGLYDNQTGLVQFGARWYDAGTSRWLTKDPIIFRGHDSNLFAYVANDPLNYIDFSGLRKILITGYGSWYERVIITDVMKLSRGPYDSIINVNSASALNKALSGLQNGDDIDIAIHGGSGTLYPGGSEDDSFGDPYDFNNLAAMGAPLMDLPDSTFTFFSCDFVDNPSQLLDGLEADLNPISDFSYWMGGAQVYAPTGTVIFFWRFWGVGLWLEGGRWYNCKDESSPK